MLTPQFHLDIRNELIVDLFAGGGGMSSAIEHATGLCPDIACNHDSDAISMHEANHPQTKHFQADVYELCPKAATKGRPVGLLHLSPDCTHHSQAAGGQPRNKATRSLSWVGKRWAGQAKPRVITLENVKEIQKWGPLVAKRCKKTGRVLKLDGTVAAPGEVVPVSQQHLVPNPKKQGQTWKRFVQCLREIGYQVEWRLLIAADFGAPTTRERLFMVARCDGQPIVWPEPTHSKTPEKGKKKWRSAAECIDFNNVGRSIFGREKPLADNTLKRIAKGIKKFVLDCPEPFIVNQMTNNKPRPVSEAMATITTGGNKLLANPVIVPIAHYNGSEPVHNTAEPLRTITATPKGGSFAVSNPVLAPVHITAGHGEGKGATQRRGHGTKAITDPCNTITASGGGQSVATAYMMQANGGFNVTVGKPMDEPMTTITVTGSQQQLVAMMIERQFGTGTGADIAQPLPTIMTRGSGKCGLVGCELGETEHKALEVAQFLINYYGNGDARDKSMPMDTITTRDRLALVTVYIKGEPFYIVDITLRMLEPKELYKAQGFPDDYRITHGHDGRQFTKTAQVRMVGNSVSPPPAIALIKANYQPHSRLRQAA